MAKKKQGFTPKKVKSRPHKTAKRLAAKKEMLAKKTAKKKAR